MASCALQSIPVKPGERFLASVFVRGTFQREVEVSLVVQWKDESGKWLGTLARQSDRLATDGAPEWTRLCLVTEVPEQASRLVFMVSAHNQGPDEAVEMDDASLLQLPAKENVEKPSCRSAQPKDAVTERSMTGR